MTWKYFLLTLAALGAVIAVAVLGPLYRLGTFPPPSGEYLANFERLWSALNTYHPYFELKGVDPVALRAQYLPRVQATGSDVEYCGIIADMLAEFQDAHTGVVSPPAYAGRLYFGTCRAVGKEIVAERVGRTGRAAGLERGAIILAVDGLLVEEALAALPLRLRSGSTPWQRRAQAAFHLLSTASTSLQVTFQGLNGKVRNVSLVSPKGISTDAKYTHREVANPLITGELLPSGLGLIRIPTFSRGKGHDLVAEFDAALEELLDAPGLILDLRGNGGGSTAIAEKIAGRFLGKPFVYGREYHRGRLPQRGWRLHIDYRVTPRRPIYHGPLVMLADELTMSTAEQFVAALMDNGRALLIGRRTAGSSGNPVKFKLPGGGLARFSIGDFRRVDGTLIEGVGLAPHMPVIYTVEDFRTGHDPDLRAAQELLLTTAELGRGKNFCAAFLWHGVPLGKVLFSAVPE